MLRRKELSSRELTATLLAWIEAADSGLNAVVQLRAEEALRAAAAVLASSDFVQPGTQLGQHQAHETYEAAGQIGGAHGTAGPH